MWSYWSIFSFNFEEMAHRMNLYYRKWGIKYGSVSKQQQQQQRPTFNHSVHWVIKPFSKLKNTVPSAFPRPLPPPSSLLFRQSSKLGMVKKYKSILFNRDFPTQQKWQAFLIWLSTFLFLSLYSLRVLFCMSGHDMNKLPPSSSWELSRLVYVDCMSHFKMMVLHFVLY